jgi:hypothetical protein
MVSSEFPQNFNQNVFMNCAQPPFDNVKVRQAIGFALNKELIIRALLQGFGRVQDSIVGDLPALRWAHDPSIKSEYNVAKANQLLDEAGFPKKGANRFTVTILATEGFRVKLSEAVKAMLAQVGIDASIKAYTWSSYIARIRQERDTAACLWSIFMFAAGRPFDHSRLPERPQPQARGRELRAMEQRAGHGADRVGPRHRQPGEAQGDVPAGPAHRLRSGADDPSLQRSGSGSLVPHGGGIAQRRIADRHDAVGRDGLVESLTAPGTVLWISHRCREVRREIQHRAPHGTTVSG